MSLSVVMLVLFAALLHASWNAMAKSVAEPLFGIGSFRLVCAALSIPLIPFVATPDPASWPALFLSTVIHTVYYFTASASLKHGDLSQVYPLYRGISPLLVAILSTWFAAEVLTPLQWVAVSVISVGLLSLAWSRDIAARITRPALIWGTMTAVLIASYTVVDGVGVRLTENPLSYIIWLFALEALPIGSWLLTRRRKEFMGFLMANPGRCLLGGLASSLAYGLVIFAMSLGAIALVSSLRETSVIFAAIIGTVFLGERFGRQRILAATLVAVGVVLVRWASL